MVMDDSSLEIHCLFVDTNLEKLCKERSQCFPEVGKITISALKVERNGQFYHLTDSMNVSKAFDNNSNQDWFLSVDAAVRLDKGKLIDAAASNLNPDELLEKNSKTTNDAEALEREVDNEKKTKKRKMKRSRAKKRRGKKSTDESLKLSGNVEVEVSSETYNESSEKDAVCMGEDKQACDVEMLGQEEFVN